MLWGARVTDDILSQGDDRGPGQWPRRVTVIAALIAVVVGGAVYLAVPRHHGAPAAARQTPGTALPSPVIPSAPGAPGVPAGPNGITGRTLAWDRSLRLPAAGSRPVWFSPASGHADPIVGLPARPVRLPVHPRHRRLGGAARLGRAAPLRQLCGSPGAGLVPRRRRTVGDAAGRRQPGRARRHRRRRMADQLSPWRQHEHRGRGGAGRPATRARRSRPGRSRSRLAIRSSGERTAACC